MSERDAFPFLGPSGRPDSLGRLGHYEVLEVLGQGGFGIVFRAMDETLQRIVAVKVLAPLLAATAPARKRFLREARSSAAVRHEHVVQIHAVEETPLPYLVMEFVPGETLQERIDRLGPLDVHEVVGIGRQLAEGLAAAHATGLIHRDVKPANVLIERGPHAHARLTDFGLARAADDASISQSGLVVGTPLYMSPEQARGGPLDHRTDLFSLGSVMYVMASGRPPFQAASTLAVLKRVAEDTPRPIPEIIPEVPQWLCDIIARLHTKEPAERFQSAQEVADLLARWQTTIQPAPGRRSSRDHSSEVTLPAASPVAQNEVVPKVGSRPSGRRWLTAAAVVLLLLAGLGLTEATGVTQLRSTIARLFSSEETPVVERPIAPPNDEKPKPPQKSNGEPAEPRKVNDPPNRIRNPFKLADIVGFDDQEVQAFAREVKLAADARDANAEQWARAAADGKEGSLDGTWDSRWESAPGSDWTYGTAQIQVIGDRVYILHKDRSGTYLMEASRTGKRLVGRYVLVARTTDTTPVVAEIVDDERIDGRWKGGRWDFRRKLPVKKD